MIKKFIEWLFYSDYWYDGWNDVHWPKCRICKIGKRQPSCGDCLGYTD